VRGGACHDVLAISVSSRGTLILALVLWAAAATGGLPFGFDARAADDATTPTVATRLSALERQDEDLAKRLEKLGQAMACPPKTGPARMLGLGWLEGGQNGEEESHG